MASKLNGSTPAASPAREKHSPKKSKKKAKQKPNDEAAMGCSPSQAMIVQSTKAESSQLRPTIFMVGEKSFQMLRELGELKFYQLAQYNEAEETAESQHHDFAAHLENPMQYLRQEHAKITSTSYKTEERSTIHQTCKIKTDYTIHVHSTKAEITRDEDGLTKREKHVHFKKISGTPSHSTPSDDTQTTDKNDKRSPTRERTKMPLAIETHHEELFVQIDSNNSRINFANDPLDEIISVPDTSGTTTASAREESSADIKSKTKAFFGRNRVTPKRDVSDKDDPTNLEQNNDGIVAVQSHNR